MAAGSRQAARVEPIAMLLLRTEGIASSFIEGLRVSLVDVAAAEIGDTTNPTAKYIADNLTAVVEALATSQRAMTVNDVHNWHRQLMRDSNLPPEMVGAFRTTQSWIGGTSPSDAALAAKSTGSGSDAVARPCPSGVSRIGPPLRAAR